MLRHAAPASQLITAERDAAMPVDADAAIIVYATKMLLIALLRVDYATCLRWRWIGVSATLRVIDAADISIRYFAAATYAAYAAAAAVTRVILTEMMMSLIRCYHATLRQMFSRRHAMLIYAAFADATPPCQQRH